VECRQDRSSDPRIGSGAPGVPEFRSKDRERSPGGARVPIQGSGAEPRECPSSDPRIGSGVPGVPEFRSKDREWSAGRTGVPIQGSGVECRECPSPDPRIGSGVPGGYESRSALGSGVREDTPSRSKDRESSIGKGALPIQKPECMTTGHTRPIPGSDVHERKRKDFPRRCRFPPSPFDE
jgi:hypothetical protein